MTTWVEHFHRSALASQLLGRRGIWLCVQEIDGGNLLQVFAAHARHKYKIGRTHFFMELFDPPRYNTARIIQNYDLVVLRIIF